MSANINMHVNSQDVLRVSSTFLAPPGEHDAETVIVRIGAGNVRLDLFLEHIEDVDALAFELNTLTRALRAEHNWTTAKDNGNV